MLLMESFLLFYLQPMFGCIRLKLHIPFSYMPFWNMKRTKLPMIDINFRALIHLHLGHLREKHEQRTTVHLENNIFSDSNFLFRYIMVCCIPSQPPSTAPNGTSPFDAGCQHGEPSEQLLFFPAMRWFGCCCWSIKTCSNLSEIMETSQTGEVFFLMPVEKGWISTHQKCLLISR